MLNNKLSDSMINLKNEILKNDINTNRKKLQYKKIINDLNAQNKKNSNLNYHFNNKSKPNMIKYLNIKPKIKKSKNIVNGTMSYLLNNNYNVLTKKYESLPSKNYDKYDDIYNNYISNKLPQIKKINATRNKSYNLFSKIPEQKLESLLLNNTENITTSEWSSKNNKIREKAITSLANKHKNVYNKIKTNIPIIKNWLNYINYMDKYEFNLTVKSIGINISNKLFSDLFWIFDVKGDGVIDEHELDMISQLFKTNNFGDKIKGTFISFL